MRVTPDQQLPFWHRQQLPSPPPQNVLINSDQKLLEICESHGMTSTLFNNQKAHLSLISFTFHSFSQFLSLSGCQQQDMTLYLRAMSPALGLLNSLSSISNLRLFCTNTNSITPNRGLLVNEQWLSIQYCAHCLAFHCRFILALDFRRPTQSLL